MLLIGFTHWIIFTLEVILFAKGTHGQDNLMNSVNVQCKANCKRYFNNPNQNEIPDIWKKWVSKEDLIQLFKENGDNYAKECFHICDQQQISSAIQNSPKFLNLENYGCWMGQLFFQRSLHQRSGTCPNNPIDKLTKNIENEVLSCKDSCISDEDCHSPLLKCCKVGCKRMCIVPEQSDEKIPEIPKAPLIIRHEDKMRVEIVPWSSYTQMTDIIFVIQARFCKCYTFDKDLANNWESIHLTEHLYVDIEHLPKGQLVQFRIAAVNSYGTRGFGEPSLPFPEKPLTPDLPGMPRNVTEAQWKFGPNFKVEILLKWEAPQYSDLEINEYNITWVRDDIDGLNQSNGKSLSPLTIHQKTIPASKRECLLDNLNPGSRYRVHLVSLAHWPGYGVLKSKAHVYYIKPNDPYVTKNDFNAKLHEFNRDPCDCSRTKLNDRNMPVILHEPEYEHKRVSIKMAINDYTRPTTRFSVEWSPKVCIETEENHYLIPEENMHTKMRQDFTNRNIKLTNLKFQCTYSVNITKYDVITKKRHYHSSFCFCTKSCPETFIVSGSPHPICSNNFRLPPPRPKLVREKLLNNSNGHYIISWKIDPFSMTQNDQSSQIITPEDQIKFRVTWGPRIYEPIDERMYNSGYNFVPILDERNSQVKVINRENDNQILLQSLKPDTVYLVKVQTLLFTQNGQELESPVEVIYFKTKGRDLKSKKFMSPSASTRITCLSFIYHLLLLAFVTNLMP